MGFCIQQRVSVSFEPHRTGTDWRHIPQDKQNPHRPVTHKLYFICLLPFAHITKGHHRGRQCKEKCEPINPARGPVGKLINFLWGGRGVNFAPGSSLDPTVSSPGVPSCFAITADLGQRAQSVYTYKKPHYGDSGVPVGIIPRLDSGGGTAPAGAVRVIQEGRVSTLSLQLLICCHTE